LGGELMQTAAMAAAIIRVVTMKKILAVLRNVATTRIGPYGPGVST
jgi:hypothetical protein